jgi:hypothetical protein
MNGAGILRFQVITHCIFGGACLTVKLWSVRHYGISAIPWATIFTYGLLIMVPNALYVPGLLRRMTTNAYSRMDPATGDTLV